MLKAGKDFKVFRVIRDFKDLRDLKDFKDPKRLLLMIKPLGGCFVKNRSCNCNFYSNPLKIESYEKIDYDTDGCVGVQCGGRCR